MELLHKDQEAGAVLSLSLSCLSSNLCKGGRLIFTSTTTMSVGTIYFLHKFFADYKDLCVGFGRFLKTNE